MTDQEFEALVALGIDEIPERFLRRLSNVAIVIADEPTPEQREKNHLGHDWTLFGLYEGIPLTERGEQYGGLVLPDKITIFKLPILAHAQGDKQEVLKIIRETVWHEIAHYFGMSEEDVERREKDGTNHSR